MISRLLLCTDMDRTVIPNGRQREHPRARALLHTLCTLANVKLVYVTGRNLQLVEEAVNTYALPLPDHIITDVGTRIYKQTKGKFAELSSWQEIIARDWRGKTHRDLRNLLRSEKNFELQETAKQDTFKLSYYLPADSDHDAICQKVEKRLAEAGAEVSCIASIDEAAQIGLLDILPRKATKLHGLHFVRKSLGFREKETIFAGDSGNDLPVLVSSVPSILVANADPALQEKAAALAEKNGNSDAFYQAENQSFPYGGNYSAGVIQGVIHYMPEIGVQLNL